MSTHPVATALDTQELRDACAANFGAGRITVTAGQAGFVAYVAAPDLTAVEAEAFAALVTLTGSPLALQPSDWVTIRGELPAIQAFMAVQSPTQAQAVAALRSVITILNAVLRPHPAPPPG